jgi:type IV fimbrial biogenesis protein FimT
MIAKNRVAGLVNEFSAVLHQARSEAIKRGKTVTVCKSDDPGAATATCSTMGAANWTSGWLLFVDANGNGSYDTGGTTPDTLLKVGQPASKNVIVAGTDFANYVSYLPDGTSAGTGNAAARMFTIDIEPEPKHYICIRTTGQIRIKTDPDTCS